MKHLLTAGVVTLQTLCLRCNDGVRCNRLQRSWRLLAH